MLDHEELAARLADLIANGNLGVRSRWNLETGLNAAATESVTGFLVIEIPPKLDDRLDIHFTAGDCELVTRWDGR